MINVRIKYGLLVTSKNLLASLNMNYKFKFLIIIKLNFKLCKYFFKIAFIKKYIDYKLCFHTELNTKKK